MPTNPAANPPKACDNAVRCGTAVSGTFESGTPIRPPTITANAIHGRLDTATAGFSKVPPIPRTIAQTPAHTPRRALCGEFIHLSEKMKRTLAAK